MKSLPQALRRKVRRCLQQESQYVREQASRLQIGTLSEDEAPSQQHASPCGRKNWSRVAIESSIRFRPQGEVIQVFKSEDSSPAPICSAAAEAADQIEADCTVAAGYIVLVDYMADIAEKKGIVEDTRMVQIAGKAVVKQDFVVPVPTAGGEH